MKAGAWLRLARVSNLPTVWTNVLAGIAVAGGSLSAWTTPLLLVALSLFYVGGMFLNDAFDSSIDRLERPQRPIPAGEVALEHVFAAGFGTLLLGLALVLWAANGFPPRTGWPALVAGITLAGAILAYDSHHKGNRLSPLWMAACRALAYVTAGCAVAYPVANEMWVVALIGGCHIVGLTYAAKQENIAKVENMWPLAVLAVPVLYGLWLALGSIVAFLLWLGLLACIGLALHRLKRRGPGDVGQAVVTLIAAVSLLDGIFMSHAGYPGLAFVAVLCFAATLALQRWVKGT